MIKILLVNQLLIIWIPISPGAFHQTSWKIIFFSFGTLHQKYGQKSRLKIICLTLIIVRGIYFSSPRTVHARNVHRRQCPSCPTLGLGFQKKKRTPGLKRPQLKNEKRYCDGPKKKMVTTHRPKLGYQSKKSDLGPKCSLPKNMDFRPNLAVIGILGQIFAFLAHLVPCPTKTQCKPGASVVFLIQGY